MDEGMNQAKLQPAASGSRRDVAAIISWVLRIGVLGSSAVIVTGLVLLIATGEGGYPDGAFPVTLPDILQGVMELRPSAVMMMGLMCLILTPITRVITSILVFVLEKDLLYSGIAVTVLVILIVSIAVGMLV